jgi:hypothetical protein
METKIKEGFFAPRRFAQLLFRDLAGGYRSLLIMMGAVAGGLLLFSVLTALGTSMTRGPVPGFYLNFYGQLLYLGGFIVTSLAFQEARRNGAALGYLMLPASPFEKLLSKLLATSVGYALGSLIFFTAASALSEGVNHLVFGFGLGFFNPFTAEVWKSIGHYLILQSVFLAGSVWFRKMPLVKTALSILVFAVACGTVVSIAGGLMFADRLSAQSVTTSPLVIHGNGWNLDLSRIFAEGTPAMKGIEVFQSIVKVLFYGLLAPAAWLAAYFKLRETEA